MGIETRRHRPVANINRLVLSTLMGIETPQKTRNHQELQKFYLPLWELKRNTSLSNFRKASFYLPLWELKPQAGGIRQLGISSSPVLSTLMGIEHWNPLQEAVDMACSSNSLRETNHHNRCIEDRRFIWKRESQRFGSLFYYIVSAQQTVEHWKQRHWSSFWQDEVQAFWSRFVDI